MALAAVSRPGPRAALAADGRSGDGAGITTSIPRLMFANFLADCGFDAAADAPLGVAMMFVEPEELAAVSEHLSAAVLGQGLKLLCWREVPVHLGALGKTAL